MEKSSSIIFADDVLIFCKATSHSLQRIKSFFVEMESTSGLKINPSKSKIIFCNVHESDQPSLAAILNWEIANLPLKYLGLPLFSGCLTEEICRDLTDKFDKKLSSWKMTSLSYSGRLCLIKHNLQSLPVFWMQSVRLPRATIQKLEASMARFLWADNPIGTHKYRWKAWSTLCRPKEEGGVGLKKLEAMNDSLLAKRIEDKIAWTIEDGQSALFWLDKWGDVLLKNCIQANDYDTVSKDFHLNVAMARNKYLLQSINIPLAMTQLWAVRNMAYYEGWVVNGAQSLYHIIWQKCKEAYKVFQWNDMDTNLVELWASHGLICSNVVEDTCILDKLYVITLITKCKRIVVGCLQDSDANIKGVLSLEACYGVDDAEFNILKWGETVRSTRPIPLAIYSNNKGWIRRLKSIIEGRRKWPETWRSLSEHSGHWRLKDDTIPFNIGSLEVEWGAINMVDGERRLLANALLDFSNERFVLLSESCIPVYDFATVYDYLINSEHSFVQSYDDPSGNGRGRYRWGMRPDIKLSQWRKGSQWFEINRQVAIKIVSDTKYLSIFRMHCKPPCYPDEHYVPTYLNMFSGSLNSNRSLTWVDWSKGGPHPAKYEGVNITENFISLIRNNGTNCVYNSKLTSVCYLFARKFAPGTAPVFMCEQVKERGKGEEGKGEAEGEGRPLISCSHRRGGEHRRGFGVSSVGRNLCDNVVFEISTDT
ncbi:putative ribonuclease H protein [Nymphaea thermarum]|nr:putative ribonuclease H protein [Nymphaea thermarum]